MRSCGLSVLLLLLFSVVSLTAQQTTTSIRGNWGDMPSSTGEIEGVYVAFLYEGTTGGLLQKQVLSEKGTFTFHDVPLGSYRIDIQRGEVIVARSFVQVKSAQPIIVNVEKEDALLMDEVVVTSPRYADRRKTATSTIFTSSEIVSLPTTSPEKRMESILMNTPGVVPDEDGRFHIRGEDAQLQYVIDGIPVTANMTRIYGSLFDTRLVSSMEIQTGALDAEYGVATSGVVLVNTRSGFDAPSFLRASGSYGSFNTVSGSLQGGGVIGGNLSGLVAVGFSSSDRYLDPISNFDPIHDKGGARHLFAKVDWNGSKDIDLSALFSMNRTEFEIPNGKVNVPAQDQRQVLNDYLFGVRGISVIGNDAVLTALLYWRKGTAEATSGGLSRLETPDEYEKAVAENEKFFVGLDRVNQSFGGNLDLSFQTNWFGAKNLLKVGGGGEVYPLAEFFTFAVTNPALSSSDTVGGDNRLAPYDLTKGGDPFLVDREMTGQRFSGFVQDRLEWGKWRLNAGLRFDYFNLLDVESAISPRLAVAYLLNDRTTLRGSYNRIVMQAPVENILVSSSSQAMVLSGEEQQSVPLNVRSEKGDVVELDADFLLNDYLSLTAAAYGKSIEDFLVKAELGNSGIIFPINLKNGLVVGGEVSTALREWHNLSALLTLSGGIAYGLIPEDGSSPVSAGLIIGEEGYFYSHPFKEEDHFPTEHSQLFEASLNLHYALPGGFFAILEGRLDSGLPFDLVDANGKGLDPEASRQELRSRGYSDDVIDLLNLESERPGSPDKAVAPHGTIDLAAGVDLDQWIHTHARITATVTNVFDTPYLYKFESSFGGTHFGQPRMGAVSLEVEL